MPSIIDYTLDELKILLSDWNEKTFRAEQIFDWVYKKSVWNPSEMTNLPKLLIDHLCDEVVKFPLEIVESVNSKDGCVKALFRCSDDIKIEGVALPSDDGRTTFCISSQAGCPLGCVFCATGKMGFKRNLTTGEIVSQVLLLERIASRPSNIVLMGMGESLLNFEEVHKFIEIISEPKGYGLSERRITLSTAGLLKELTRFHKLHPKIELAISINSSNNLTRKKIMPNARLATFSEIIDLVRELKTDVTLEYVMLDGINSSKEDAERLGKILKNLNYVRVNLIKYNNTSTKMKPPSEEQILQFQRILRDSGVKCFRRKSLGEDISAACGQMSG